MTNENQQLPINLQDFYLIIGEKEALRFLMAKEIDRQNQQIMEMSKTIGELRQQLDGKLEQPAPIDPIRRFPSGVQGPGLGLGLNVPGPPDQPSRGDDQIEPLAGQAPRVGWDRVVGPSSSD